MDGSNAKPVDGMDAIRAAIEDMNAVQEAEGGGLLVPTQYYWPDHSRIEIRVSIADDHQIEIEDQGILAARAGDRAGAIESKLDAVAGLTYANGTLLAVVEDPSQVGHAIIAVAEAAASIARSFAPAG